MCRAVTLSRSPPRAETTMMATGERSLIWRHRSKPSTSGSIRSSSTMSGSSVSSSWSAFLPSTDTTVSNPRTARFALMRSTILGSSSTTRAQVLVFTAAVSLVTACSFDGQAHTLNVQANTEAGALADRVEFHGSVMCLHDAPCDRKAKACARGAAAAAAWRRHAAAGVLHGDLQVRVLARRGDLHRRFRRVVGERVRQQVHQDLLHPVMVGPDDRQRGFAADGDLLGAGRRKAGDRGIDDQADVAPVRLQPHDARLDRGEVEEVIDQPAQTG